MEQEVNVITTEETPSKAKHKFLKSKERKPRKKIKKRWFVLGGLIIVIAVVYVMCSNAANNAVATLLALEETSLIEEMELTYSISATGTVISADTKNVYSTQSYTVEEVFVKVGDKVNEGDPLCKLDSKALEDQIAKKELAIGVSAEAASQQVKTQRDSYNATKSALNDGMNSSLISAESQVATALNNYEKAQKTYDEYRANLNRDQNSSIMSAETSVNNARTAMDNAYDAMSSAKKEYDAVNISYGDTTQLGNDASAAKAVRDQARIDYDVGLEKYAGGDNTVDLTTLAANYDSAEFAYNTALQAYNAALSASTTIAAKKAAYNAKSDAYSSACDSYDNAKKQLDAAYRSANSTLADYAKNVETAYESYQTALASLSATERSVDSQIQSSKNSLASSEISSNNELSLLELAQMQEDLEKTTVTATKTGTITAVYAKEGNSGSGLLFVIEDTENLKVDTTVKEYDMGTVKVGQKVTIKSDATGNEVMDGVIDNISPASRKTAAGAIDTAGDVVFPTEVVVTTKGTGLKIGMSVRLNYIIEQQIDRLAVPYEAVYTNAAGQTCVLKLTDQGDGTYLVEELPVTVGMETDLYIDVSGDGVTSGIRVINTAESFRIFIGQKIPVSEQRISSGGGGAGFGMRMGRAG